MVCIFWGENFKLVAKEYSLNFLADEKCYNILGKNLNTALNIQNIDIF